MLVTAADLQQEIGPVAGMVFAAAATARLAALDIAPVDGAGAQVADRGDLLEDPLTRLLQGRDGIESGFGRHPIFTIYK